jgi:hypothetical protein
MASSRGCIPPCTTSSDVTGESNIPAHGSHYTQWGDRYRDALQPQLSEHHFDGDAAIGSLSLWIRFVPREAAGTVGLGPIATCARRKLHFRDGRQNRLKSFDPSGGRQGNCEGDAMRDHQSSGSPLATGIDAQQFGHRP